MTLELPDFVRRAMEAQGKVDPDEVARLAALEASEGGGLVGGPPATDSAPSGRGAAPSDTSEAT